MSEQRKHLIIKSIWWKRVCNNTQRFGWVLYDAYDDEETTTTTTYTSKVVGNNVVTEKDEKTERKITTHLYFYRNRDDYANLLAIFPLELIYNIFFLARRILGLILPVLSVGILLINALGESEFLFEETKLGFNWIVVIAIWLGLILLENLFAFIASKILKRKQ